MFDFSDKKNRAILFLLSSLVLTGGVFYWMTFLNKGIVKISTEDKNFPFEVEITPGHSFYCENQESCSKELFPESYLIEVEKPGFFIHKEEVNISRGRETQVNPEFIFRPRIEKAKATKVEIPWHKKSDSFADNQSLLGSEFFIAQKNLNLELLPEKTSSVIFSPTGQVGIVQDEEGYFLWQEKGIEEIEIFEKNDIEGFVWSFQDVLLYWKEKEIYSLDLSNESQKITSIKKGKITNIFPSREGDQFCFLVKKEDGDKQIFIFSLSENAQKLLAETKRSIDFILPPEKGGIALVSSGDSVFYLEANEEKELQIPFYFDLRKTLWLDEERLISARKKLPTDLEIGNAKDVFNLIKNIFNENNETFFEYSPKKRILKPLVEAKIDEEALNPTAPFWERENKSLVFLSDGEVYRLILDL